MIHSVPILAAMLTPALFYGGMAAMGAPILIHLLSRRRFKRIRWAAMEFLIDAERRNRRRIRMEEWILLALRCLAVFLIGMMVARPFVQPNNLAAAFGGTHRSERIFLLDDSMSMGYQVADGMVFDRAKIAVKKILETIRQESPDDTVTLIRMSDSTRPVEASTFLDDTQTEEVLQRLEALTPSQKTIHPSRVMRDVADLLEKSPDITHATVYILSDFQRHDWISSQASTDSGSTSAGLLSPLSDWAKEERGLRVIMIDLSEQDASNTSVSDIKIRDGQLVAGTSTVIRTSIENHSEKTINHIELHVSVGNQVQPSSAISELTARQVVQVDLEVDFLRSGYEGVRVELPPDSLMADNIRYASVEVVNAIRILLVNGEPSADFYDDEVSYLSTALRPEGEQFSGNEIVVADETQLADVNLDTFHLVILTNVYRVSEPAVESLERFVRLGGGLMICLGDQVDADLFNSILYRDGDGLSPARLIEVIRAPDAAHLMITDRLHPILGGFSKEGDPLGIGQIPFYEYFGCEPFTGSDFDQSVQDENNPQDESSAFRSRLSIPARVIARFDDADETPAILERPLGAGRVLLITTAVDKEWNLWPDHPTYLPLMLEMSLHTAKNNQDHSSLFVGEPIELTLDATNDEPDVVIRTPAYPNEQEAVVTATPAGEGRGLQLSWEHTNAAGLYQFLIKKRNGMESTRLVAVNVDPQESDLTSAVEEELRHAAQPVPVEYIKGIDQLGGVRDEVRTELWRLCLIAAVLMLMCEQGLAWWWGRQR